MLTLQFPVIPGRDVAGEVVAAGAAVVSAREHPRVVAQLRGDLSCEKPDSSPARLAALA
jgi:NADPH:quinone reductase-like Zn-dependent oxidoreductase